MSRVDIFTKRVVDIGERFLRRGNEIPVPTDKVLLIDIDGTLINNNYQMTDPRINKTVEQLQVQGWTVGLSSDTPLEAMRVWKDRFGMNGPIIAEKGAIVEVDNKVMVDETDVATFANSRTAIEQKLEENGILIWRGNPVEAIREGLQVGNPGDVVVLVNALRRASIGFFVRQVDSQGNLAIDNNLTDTVIGSIRDLYPRFSDLDEDLNHQFGLVIAARKKVSKRLGTVQLMKDKGLTEVGMVGDSMTDFVGGDIAKHYAVANAKEAFKGKADYIASKPITEGVVEILQKLRKAAVYRRRG